MSQSIVAKTSEGDGISEGVDSMVHAYNINIVTNQVTFSDEQDSEIQRMCPDLSLH